jgi:two-component system sensor histidine kinase/response regulator
MLDDVRAPVSLCDDAARARQELRNTRQSGFLYDVILLDSRMSPDDGLALAREFDQSERDRDIVMFTRDDFPRGPRDARDAGLVRHLMKPIKRGELLDAMASVAARCQTAVGSLAANPLPSKADNVRALTILLAEDSEDNRLLIAAYLRGTPHRLETAENGRVAVEMFKTRTYDLVLMDINMPILDGLSAASAIRAWEGQQRIKSTPIVTVTGRAMVEDRSRSIEVGCNGHLTKPLPRAVLMEAISHFTSAASER